VGILCLLGLVALVVDLGYLYVVKCELQNVAEAGALAGSRALFPVPPVSGLIPAAPDCDRGRAAALDAVRANRASGKPLIIPPEDVQVGIWDWSLKALAPTPCSANTNAVRVVTRKDEKANGPAVLTFARIFGFNTLSLTAKATAMVDGIGKIQTIRT
jgi:Flp pilus assembly protein TadG